MKRPDRWLSILLLAAALKQGIFFALIPAWQVPDEPAHVAYVQALVEAHQFPVFSASGMDVSNELATSLWKIEETNPRRIGRHYPPGFLVSPPAGQRLPVEAGMPIRNLAARNSPAYYLYESIPYFLSYPASIETRLMFMRLASAMLLLVTVWVTVKIGRILSTDRWFGLTIGLVVGFHPAATSLFAGVNPDAALTLVATWAFWLMIRPVESAQLWRRGILIALAIGAAASLKSPGWFLVVPAGLWLMRQFKKTTGTNWLKLAGMMVGIHLSLGGMWLLIQHGLTKSDVIDFYGTQQPPLSWQQILNNDLFERPVIVWRTWWGHLGWSGVSRYSQPWAYLMMLVMSLMSGVGLLLTAARKKFQLPSAAWLFLSSLLALEALYQILYWRAGLVAGTSHFPTHGRYYLPLIAPIAVFLVAGVSGAVPKKARRVSYGLVSVAVVVCTSVLAIQTWGLYAAERAAGW